MFKKVIQPIVLLAITASLLSGCSINAQKNQNTETNTQNNSVTEVNPAQGDTTSETLLNQMKELAADGKALGSDVIADGNHNISDVYTQLGEPAQPEMWIGDAKGLYSVYEKQNLVFGSNKGGAIFEIRSTSPDLKAVGYQDVIKVYGEPDKTNNTESETIIGYKINDRFKLLLVFPKLKAADDNPSLDHYSVFYPKGTANNMADDPGREW